MEPAFFSYYSVFKELLNPWQCHGLTGLALFSSAAKKRKTAQNPSYILVNKELTSVLPKLKLALFFIFLSADFTDFRRHFTYFVILSETKYLVHECIKKLPHSFKFENFYIRYCFGFRI
jgi:hypothetical protein